MITLSNNHKFEFTTASGSLRLAMGAALGLVGAYPAKIVYKCH